MRLAALSVMAFSLLVLAVDSARAETLTVVAFNVESGGADSSRVADDMRSIPGVDVWGLSEVQNDEVAHKFLAAAKQAGSGGFRYILGRSGGADRLAIIYSTDKFDLIEAQELLGMRLRPNGSLSFQMRGQLSARLRLKSTGSEFHFAVNHLKCCDDTANDIAWRGNQINTIREWVQASPFPKIVVGDFNTPLPPNQDDTAGTEVGKVVESGVLEWLPPPLAGRPPTHCGGSMLDYVFVAGDAKQWAGTSEILFPEADYCIRDASDFADHRPLRAVFQVP